ncbi:MAG TPA: nicotinate-nucleotide adenylyltransferase [Novimethylophilus sp.]|jgi:nicotinate-nucleotide adenylyltransferase|uniref:nicotinate-nucleotide adenylyltransferase n=1 Tax=Novimethylophilus sp. TaxID=2137426 RepID=UPI002F3F9F88
MPSTGILGGTFDPIHFGHLRMAQELGASLGLDEVRFVPAARPPHRPEPHAPAQHRAAMVRSAIADNPQFAFDARELERAGPSYMFDTLASLRAELGADIPLYLLLGADAFLGLHGWHRWRELFDLAHIAVAHRPGFALDANSPLMAPELRAEWRLRYSAHAPDCASGKILLREITALDISASAVRNALAQGDSPRYLLPEPVLGYILKHKLYTSGNA